MKNKSVLVVDDEELIVQTMRDDLRLVGYQVDVAYDAQQALGLFQEIQHDLVITDLHMKTVGGIELIRKLKDFNSRTRIIVITGYGTTESAIDSLRLKVDDFILKPYDRNELLKKINTLFSGLTKKRLSPQAYRLTKEKGLSEREIEISLLMLAGKSKEEISIELYISKFTVDTHIKHIYKKMNVNSLSQFIKEFNSI